MSVGKNLGVGKYKRGKKIDLGVGGNTDDARNDISMKCILNFGCQNATKKIWLLKDNNVILDGIIIAIWMESARW